MERCDWVDSGTSRPAKRAQMGSKDTPQQKFLAAIAALYPIMSGGRLFGDWLVGQLVGQSVGPSPTSFKVSTICIGYNEYNEINIMKSVE